MGQCLHTDRSPLLYTACCKQLLCACACIGTCSCTCKASLPLQCPPSKIKVVCALCAGRAAGRPVLHNRRGQQPAWVGRGDHGLEMQVKDATANQLWTYDGDNRWCLSAPTNESWIFHGIIELLILIPKLAGFVNCSLQHSAQQCSPPLSPGPDKLRNVCSNVCVHSSCVVGQPNVKCTTAVYMA